jgi:hypothetical protein
LFKKKAGADRGAGPLNDAALPIVALTPVLAVRAIGRTAVSPTAIDWTTIDRTIVMALALAVLVGGDKPRNSTEDADDGGGSRRVAIVTVVAAAGSGRLQTHGRQRYRGRSSSSDRAARHPTHVRVLNRSIPLWDAANDILVM